MHATIKKVTADIERFNFNTALASIMELSNTTADYLNTTAEDARDKELCRAVATTLVLLLAPYAPHGQTSCGPRHSVTRAVPMLPAGRASMRRPPRLTRSSAPS